MADRQLLLSPYSIAGPTTPKYRYKGKLVCPVAVTKEYEKLASQHEGARGVGKFAGKPWCDHIPFHFFFLGGDISTPPPKKKAGAKLRWKKNPRLFGTSFLWIPASCHSWILSFARWVVTCGQQWFLQGLLNGAAVRRWRRLGGGAYDGIGVHRSNGDGNLKGNKNFLEKRSGPWWFNSWPSWDGENVTLNFT